jgi:hypothetical protein
MDWIGLAQDTNEWRVLVNAVLNLRAPQKAGKFLSSCTICSFSKRAQLPDDDVDEVSHVNETLSFTLGRLRSEFSAGRGDQNGRR